MQKKEINALIQLLEDPDEKVFAQVRHKIISLGQDIIPTLESAWEQSFEPLMQERIENIIHWLQFEQVANGLKEWKDAGGQDLFSGVLFIARYQYPDLQEEKIKAGITQLAQDVWLELNDNLTILEKIQVANRIIYDIHGFSGNKVNFHSPQNSFINTVLESKKGNPLSLAIVYQLVCEKTGLPVIGVNLPEHFVLACLDETNYRFGLRTERSDILFYINPFNKGFIFPPDEIDKFLQQINREPEESYYLPCSNIEMVKRMLQNLLISYEKQGYQEKKEEIAYLLEKIS